MCHMCPPQSASEGIPYICGSGSAGLPAFRYTSVPRCTPVSVEVQRNTDGDTPSNAALQCS